MATASTPVVEAPTTVTEKDNLVIGYKLKKVKDEKGVESIEKTPDLVAQEDQEKLEKEGKFEGVSVVTIATSYPKTFEALQKLYEGSEGGLDELVANHNRGARTKVGNRVRAIVLATDDEGNFTYDGKAEVDGVLDVTGEITSGSKRKFLTEEEKVIRSIMAMPIPEAQKQAMLAVYQGQKAA